MFHDLPPCIVDRMKHLEAMDARDRSDGTGRMERLRQIPPETGRFIALLAASAPAGRYLEIGTSAGYSTMWLALACRQLGRSLTTFELLDQKVALAEETIRRAEIGDVVNLVHGDALDALPAMESISFCFLDAEKEIYSSCYDLIVPRLVPGGLLIADNALSHEAELRPMLDRALADDRVDALVVPIGSGVLLCRKR